MKQFHLGDILSITSGRLVSPRHIDGIYDILDYMTGDKLFTHQLPRAAKQCKPYLLEQYPWLDSPEMWFAIGELILMIETPSGSEMNQFLIAGWLSKLTAKYGEYFDVTIIPEGEYRGRDPIEEFQERAPGKPIIAVNLE